MSSRAQETISKFDATLNKIASLMHTKDNITWFNVWSKSERGYFTNWEYRRFYETWSDQFILLSKVLRSKQYDK